MSAATSQLPIPDEAKMRDGEEIENYFSAPLKPLQYREKEWIEINDINQGNYNSGRVRFDTLNNLHDFLLWSKAYVLMHLRFVSSDGGNAYTNATELALRDGVASIVHGLILKINDTKVQSTDELSFMQHIRNVYEDMSCYESGVGIESYRAMDKMKRPVISVVAGANTVEPSGLDDVVGNQDTTYNGGYVLRKEHFRKNAVWVAGDTAWDLQVRVPLAEVSPVFRALNMPMNNLRMDIELSINGVGNVSNHVMYTVAGADAVRQPATVTIKDGGERPILYVPAVEFDSATLADIRSEQDPSKHPNGNWKVFKFMNHEHYERFYDAGDVDAGSNLSETITPGLRNVKKVHVVGMSRTTWTDAAGTGHTVVKTTDNPQHVGYFADVALRDVDLILDNRGFYDRPIDDDYLAYNQLVKENMRSDGYDKSCSPSISYDDFKTLRRYYSFDITRNRNIQSDANKKVAIDFKAKKGVVIADPRTAREQVSFSPDAAPWDLHFFVEYETVFKINLVNGSCVVTDK